jgi:hypothetical protein
VRVQISITPEIARELDARRHDFARIEAVKNLARPENSPDWVVVLGVDVVRARTDDPSEYGHLLAERDRLIEEGVDPDQLDLPPPP